MIAEAADTKAAAKVKVLKAPPPPLPTWFFSAEGGAACSNDHAARSRFWSGMDLAHVGNACGWTTRLGFGQENTALFGGMADYWGVFFRYTRINDSAPVNGGFNFIFPGFKPFYPYGFSGNTGFDERRTVIDFETGRDIGIGDESKVRALAGLRFAHYSSNTNVLGSTSSGYAANFFTKQQFDGIGPRIGFSYRRPVFGMIELTADGSAAGLWGRFKTNINDTLNDNGPYSISGQESHNGWVGNLEGSIALAYAPYGPRGWDVSLGVRAEDWFSQNRHQYFAYSSDAISESRHDGDEYYYGAVLLPLLAQSAYHGRAEPSLLSGVKWIFAGSAGESNLQAHALLQHPRLALMLRWPASSFEGSFRWHLSDDAGLEPGS